MERRGLSLALLCALFPLCGVPGRAHPFNDVSGKPIDHDHPSEEAGSDGGAFGGARTGTKPNKPGKVDNWVAGEEPAAGEFHILPFPDDPILNPEPLPNFPTPRDELEEAPPLPRAEPADQQRSAEDARRAEDRLNRLPDPDPIRSGRVAREYMRGADPEGAERVLDRLIDAGAGDANAYRLRSGARFQREDWKGAYLDANAALSMNPRDKVAAELAGTSKMQLQRLGIKAPEVKQEKLREGDRPEPREETARAPQGGAEYAGAGVVPLFGKAEPGTDPRLAFFAAIDRKVAIGGRQEAFLGLTRYLDQNPDDAAALAKRAYLLNRGKNPKAALADSEKALAVTPDDPAALREKAYALIQLGRAAEAMALVERAIVLQPKNGLGYLYRAMARQSLGDKTGSLADYTRAAELDPALQSYLDAALGEPGAKTNGPSAAAKWRARGLVALVAVPLLLFGLWNGARHYSGRTTRGAAGPAGAEEVTAPRLAAETLVAGNVLGGLYQVGRVLGRGGMGVVFEAWDLGLERKVAIKQLRTPDGAPEDYERFLKEARLVARLQHPNIVQIHTLVEDGGLLYLVFELVDGRPLDSVLGERVRMTPPEALDVVRDVCAALDCAHESRIIHRDLKPSNIMMTSKGDFKVMDFGIAHQAQSDVMMTQTGAWGTPPYMAPEQERGVVSRESDLFALACTVYELLTGGRPFGPGADKTLQTFKPVSSLAAGLTPQADAFMARALAGDPAHRFHSGAEFAAAFASCLSGRIAA